MPASQPASVELPVESASRAVDHIKHVFRDSLNGPLMCQPVYMRAYVHTGQTITLLGHCKCLV